MTARALIIAIENYADSLGELAKKIEGAGRAGQDFAAWFIAKKSGGVPQPGSVFVCSDQGTYPAGVQRFGVKREDILDAVDALIAAGQDQTEELYVFFSGHGFTFQDAPDKRAVAELVAADFVSAAKSGTKCLDLSELQTKLWVILGGKHHYYFVDACRNILNQGDIEPVAFGRKLGRTAQRGRPTRYTLYSTRFGETADIQSPFSAALLDGLMGKGRAKGYTSDRQLYVMFPLLKLYVANRMAGQGVEDAKEGSGDGFILQIQPVPTYRCKLTVEDAAATDQFRLRKAPAGQPEFAQEESFAGPEFEFTYEPRDMVIDVLEDGGRLERIEPPAGQRLDFFDECSAKFRRAPESFGFDGGAAAPPAPMAFDIRAINLQTADELQIRAGEAVDLGPGTWEIARLERGTAIVKQTVDVFAERPPTLDFLIPDDDPVRRRIAAILDDTETANPDLGLCVTLVAAARIMVPGQFEKLRELPLAHFGDIAPGESATFVISALRRYERVSVQAAGVWKTMERIAELEGVSQALFRCDAGPQLLSLQMDQSEVRTFVSWALPNRVTLVVLSETQEGRLMVWQFMLPVAHLFTRLPDQVREYLTDLPAAPGSDSIPISAERALEIVRTMYSFQSVFSSGRRIAPPEQEEIRRWDALLYAKWIDPVTSMIVCYDVIRRGDEQLRSLVRSPVLSNLRRYYSGIPDVAAIAVQLDPGSATRPAGPPLFTEGVFAFPDWADHLPYPADRLDYGALWTTWRGVVDAARPDGNFIRRRAD